MWKRAELHIEELSLGKRKKREGKRPRRGERRKGNILFRISGGGNYGGGGGGCDGLLPAEVIAFAGL